MTDILDEKSQKTIKIVSLSMGIFFMLGGFFVYFLDINRKASAFFFLIGLLFIILPPSILNYLKSKKQEALEAEFPLFIKNFAEVKKTGMSFPQAFEHISHTDMGPLTPYIKKTAAQISWGVPFTKSIKNLASTIESKIVKQSFIVISEAFEMGGNVVETMRDLAKNINSIKEINERRISAVSQQIMIMYFIFFIFLATLVGIYKMLIPMLSIDINMSGGLMSMGSEMEIKKKEMPNFCEVPPIAPIMCSFGILIGFDKDLNVKEYDPSGMFGNEKIDDTQPPPELGEENKKSTKSTFLYFKSLFFLMCLVQATCTGVIAGVLKSGKISASITHISLMYVVTVCVFILFV